MGTRARVIAAATVPFTKRHDLAVDQLAASAVRAVSDDTRLDMSRVDEVYVGSAKGGSLVGQRALRHCGLAIGMPVFNVENACASSAVAFHLATRAIASGSADLVLVIGVDQLSALGRGALPVQDTEWEGRNGVTNPVNYALRAQRYLHQTDAEMADLARVVVKSRSFGARNPHAQFRTATTAEEVLASRTIASPLTMFQCSAKSDGAAALVLASDRRARELGLTGPTVRASVVTSGTFSMAARDIVRPDITARAVDRAYQTAGLGPADCDVVELHDAFSIAELIYTEELGLCEPGMAHHVLRSGATAALAPDSRTPVPLINPSGGLLSRGHPIGATGAAQLVELTRQLNGTAGARQREGARIGLAHVTGGGASGFDNGACAVTILEGATR